jgi:hypothetical protein
MTKSIKASSKNSHPRNKLFFGIFSLILQIDLREQAAAQQRASSLHSPCTVLAAEKIGSPKEILDTPKENPITPKVMAHSLVRSSLLALTLVKE